MFSLTSVSLASYIKDYIRNTVNKNPRFRSAFGTVNVSSNNGVFFKDLSVIIRDINTDSNRQSLDYFICTTVGRAIVAQVADKNGSFIEWIRETDASGATPTAGVYLFNVDSVNEATREVGFTIESYRWVQGRVSNATGTKLVFRPGIDATTVTLVDPTSSTAPVIEAHGSYIYLLSSIGALLVTDSSGNLLTPLTDYWIESQESAVLVAATSFGNQTYPIPTQFESPITLTGADGYVLVNGSDYTLRGSSPTVAVFPAWTPSGEMVTVSGPVRLDPSIPANLINKENTLNIVVSPTETLVSDQVFVTTQDLSHVALTVNSDGTVVLPSPLPAGGYCQYEARILTGQSQVLAYKNAVNKGILPGLNIAIGDAVVVGDQCAILVSPTLTDTYRVYGGKPGITFSLDVKANDPATADEIAKTIQADFLVNRRSDMEADGLTITEMSSSFATTARDDSGTTISTTLSLSFTGYADWRIYQPLVTRITSFDTTVTPVLSGFAGKLTPSARYYCLQASGFIPDYR